MDLLGGGAGVADLLWARPALTVLGIDCPPVRGSVAAVPPRASARLSLRVPPGTDPVRAQDALVEHLRQEAPWGARLEIERGQANAPFLAETGGPAHTALADAMREAYGQDVSSSARAAPSPCAPPSPSCSPRRRSCCWAWRSRAA